MSAATTAHWRPFGARRLARHVVATLHLAVIAVVVAWLTLFPGSSPPPERPSPSLLRAQGAAMEPQSHGQTDCSGIAIL
jgi:hypothetical protein